jgi:hypothetical protein
MKAATLTVLAILSTIPMVGIAAQPAWGNPDHQKMLAKLKVTSLTMREERRKELFALIDVNA